MSPLLIDIGNSNARIASLESRTFKDVIVVPSDELMSYLKQGYRDDSHIIFATVGKHGVAADITAHFANASRIRTPAYEHGVINAYMDFASLGIDRWLALVGLRSVHKGPAVVVDIGTAVTVDLLDEFGQHKGGWIIPGIEMMINALIQGTARVNADHRTGNVDFACNTAKGVTNGCLAAINGVVKQACYQARMTLNSGLSPQIFLTGGQGPMISDVLDVQHQLDPMLVLRGLACYANNRQ